VDEDLLQLNSLFGEWDHKALCRLKSLLQVSSRNYVGFGRPIDPNCNGSSVLCGCLTDCFPYPLSLFFPLVRALVQNLLIFHRFLIDPPSLGFARYDLDVNWITGRLGTRVFQSCNIICTSTSIGFGCSSAFQRIGDPISILFRVTLQSRSQLSLVPMCGIE